MARTREHGWLERLPALILGIVAASLPIAGCGGDSAAQPDAAVRDGLAAVAGVPQVATTLGRDSAPATLTITRSRRTSGSARCPTAASRTSSPPRCGPAG